MARKWWGTVNLPADVDGRCNDPCHHQAITSGNAVGCAVVTWRIGRRGGVGCMGNCLMHGDETLVYVPPWAVLLHRPETLGAYSKNRPLSSPLPAAGALGSWPALGRKPAISGLSHENGSDRDDVEGGRELGWFHGRRRPFLTWGLHGQIQHRGGLWRARFNA